jgi:hypothetical protein
VARGSAFHAAIAASVNQTVRLPRWLDLLGRQVTQQIAARQKLDQFTRILAFALLSKFAKARPIADGGTFPFEE